MNRSSYDACNCPGGHPPCSFCVDTFTCDLCGDRFDVDDENSIETKAGFLCEECRETHEEIEAKLLKVAARKRRAERLSKIAAYCAAVPAMLAIFPLIVAAVLLLVAFLIVVIFTALIMHPREEIVDIQNDQQEIKTTIYLFVFLPLFTYTRFKKHSERKNNAL